MAESGNKIELVFVIGGEDFPVESNVNAPLAVAFEKALKDGDNQGRPIGDWVVRDPSGKVLDLSAKVGTLGLVSGEHLSATVKVGAGG